MVDGDLNLVFWNEEFLRLLEFPAELLAGQNPSMETLFRYNLLRGEYGPGNDEARVRAYLERACLMQPHVFERTRPNGTILEVRGLPLPEGGFVTIYTDITSRKKTEHKYAAILENAQVGILFTCDRKVVHCNPKTAALFGWASADELLGQPGSVFWPTPDDYVDIGLTAGPTLAAGEAFETERLARRKDGSVFPAHVVAKAVNPEMSSEGTIWIFDDVTERNTLEAERRRFVAQLEERSAALAHANAELKTAMEDLSKAHVELVRTEKLAALGSLVAGIAHELNTPVGNALMVATAIGDRAQEFDQARQDGTLRRSALDAFVDVVREGANQLEKNLHRSAELVLYFKQVAADESSGLRQRFRLSAVVGDALALLERRVRENGHLLEVSCPADVELDSYPVAIGQVITSLVENAILHAFPQCSSGEMKLVVEARDTDLTIAFSDTGGGIPVHNLPRVFDPFFTTRFGQGGSGLGLYIVHNIITGVLGGKITVSSEAGFGTEFRMQIPRVAPDRDDQFGIMNCPRSSALPSLSP